MPYYDLGGDSQREVDYSFLEKVFEWLIKPFKWLFDQMDGVPEALRWLIVIALVVLCVALIAHIVYTFVVAIRGPIARGDRIYQSPGREVDPDELEHLAERARVVGDYIGGVRLLFRAALRRIELFEKKKLRPGITNRELLRRYRSSPLAGPLARFVETIDLKWYGNIPCEQADYAACESEHDRIRQFAQATAIC